MMRSSCSGPRSRCCVSAQAAVQRAAPAAVSRRLAGSASSLGISGSQASRPARVPTDPSHAAPTAAAAPANTQRLQAAIASPAGAGAAGLAFAALAWAVFAPAGAGGDAGAGADATAAASIGGALHLLDATLHAHVRACTDAAWRLDVGEHIISDGPIALGMAAWAALTARAAAADARRAAAPLSVCWLFYALVAGPGVAGFDPPAVHALKALFGRVRPSLEIHTSYSFPSGHTTAAAFLAGAALLVLLPLARRLERGGGKSDSGGSSSGAGTGDGDDGRLPDGIALPVWAAATLTTACGRVLADAVSGRDRGLRPCRCLGLRRYSRMFTFLKALSEPVSPTCCFPSFCTPLDNSTGRPTRWRARRLRRSACRRSRWAPARRSGRRPGRSARRCLAPRAAPPAPPLAPPRMRPRRRLWRRSRSRGHDDIIIACTVVCRKAVSTRTLLYQYCNHRHCQPSMQPATRRYTTEPNIRCSRLVRTQSLQG